MNSVYLRKVVSYWRNQFDWKKQVQVLNKYPHFKTKIEGKSHQDQNQSSFNYIIHPIHIHSTLHNIKICTKGNWFVVCLSQDWMCTLSMSGQSVARGRGSCLWCLFMDGQAHSSSSTKSFHCSQRHRMSWCLRSSVPLFQDMATRKPHTNKVKKANRTKKPACTYSIMYNVL